MMNLQPTISIITPAYNAEEFLGDTIQSVREQTFRNWEMIIIDDCSNDNTSRIAEENSKEDKRIKLIRLATNVGVAAARNIGLDNAMGDYIAFLDSDDIWRHDKLEKQLGFMERNKYVFTYTMFQKFNSDTGKTGRIIRVPQSMTYKEIYKNTVIGCLTVMVNRKEVGEFHMPCINHAEDQCTWQIILKRGYVAYGLQENLAWYRERTTSLTHNKREAIEKQWTLYRYYYHFSLIKSGYYFTRYAINAFLRNFC